MKKLLILLLICQSLNAQIDKWQFQPEPKYSAPVKVILLLSSSVVLEAIGDGLYDEGQKQLGKLFQASSVGLLVASPFLLDIDRSKWGWYLMSYISFRIALFDPVYNMSRGLPIEYIGSTSYWDEGMKVFNPPAIMNVWGRSMFFVVAISIPINRL